MPLYIREMGSIEAPAIVFLHGLGLTSSMWQPQFERLLDYHCLAPDLPESGRSADIGPLTLKDAGQRVAALIQERVPSGRAHVVGLSMGGAVAVRMLLDVPEVLDHVIVSGAAARLSPILATLNRLNEPVMRLLRPEQLADLMLRQFNIPQAYRGLVLEGARTVKPEAISHFSQEMTRIDLPRETHVPLLMTVGEKETLPAKRAARKIVKTIRGATGAIVQEVGHAWNLQAPDLFTAMVRAWVRDEKLPEELVLF